MTVREYLEREAAEGRTVEMLARHPEREERSVPAFSVFDAKMQALSAWGLPFEEIEHIKVYIKKRITPPASQG